jgi:hypothetical protein
MNRRELAGLVGSYRISFSIVGNFPPLSLDWPVEILPWASISNKKAEGPKIEVKVEAVDLQNAWELAREQARIALALFQVGLAGAVSQYYADINESQYLHENLSEGESGYSDRGIGLIEHMEESSVVFVEESASDAVKRLPQFAGLLNASDCRIMLYYYQRAMREKDLTYRFLNLMTAIESILSDQGETTEKLARRLAVLTQSSYQNMQETYQWFKEIYGTRSLILHGDKVPNLTKHTVDKLSGYASVALHNYLILRTQGNENQVRTRLDRFLDAVELSKIKNDTTL